MNAQSILVASMLLLAGFGDCARADEKTNAPAAVMHVQSKEAAQLLASGGVTVLDLRTPKEFAAGHIAGATNIDCRAGDFAARLEKLDRENPFLVHCASGRRSTNALPEFEKLGFKHIIHLDGGLKGWEAAKNPVEKP